MQIALFIIAGCVAPIGVAELTASCYESTFSGKVRRKWIYLPPSSIFTLIFTCPPKKNSKSNARSLYPSKRIPGPIFIGITRFPSAKDDIKVCTRYKVERRKYGTQVTQLYPPPPHHHHHHLLGYTLASTIAVAPGCCCQWYDRATALLCLRESWQQCRRRWDRQAQTRAAAALRQLL